MSRYFQLSKALVILLCLNIVVHTKQAQLQPWSPLDAPKEILQMLSRDPVTISLASTDFGHIIHQNPFAIFAPSSINDISKLIKFSNSLPIPFTIAARGQGHSVNGQSMTNDGIVVNMTELNNELRNNGNGIVVFDKYVDVGGGQRWIDVLHASLEKGLTPLSWTDYLYLSVGGTLSNAGISGQTFRFGPQISNVHELDVVTGKGDLVTCSTEKNSELFYAVLGGLGQFGIITRARIALGPAPKRVKWLRLLYNDFSAFSGDQEHLISLNGIDETNAPNYVEGFLLLNQPPLDLSFFPEIDQPRITSLVTQYGIIYIVELAKYYDENSQDHVDQEIEILLQGLKFVPTFKFEKDVSYEEFLDRVHTDELTLRAQGLWNIPHPWLDLFVPGSRMSEFNEGVLKGIILKQNITAGLVIVYPMNRTKWDDKMSAVTPNEEIFYVVDFLRATGFDNLEAYKSQNQQILQFCKDVGIEIKHYLPLNRTHEEWVEQYGLKWNAFEKRKNQFDPNKILSPGQGIFN
ncbi:putative cytokinin dehydrogenase [Medicago truncatula]|uniref:cytokinin dehydrogenase n=1 Tax=Medicago truncatula TaxID=3880 RepID=A0A072URS8_MEDTR|nr:cytokinin dehydrogenase 3 [Medicago truncatula]KEH32514.1 cytokinin oxidase/dehydrogenase-like protein [Medicago truncatula]RHN64629.1 putative cytokinin dehydrogenase [Medicago truncatula]